MAEIIWSERALQNIQEIAEFIEKDSVQYAQTQVQSFFERANVLTKHPHAGRPVPELKDANIRQLLCGSYRLVYEVLPEERISILTIHHQSRLLQNNPTFKDKKFSSYVVFPCISTVINFPSNTPANSATASFSRRLAAEVFVGNNVMPL